MPGPSERLIGKWPVVRDDLPDPTDEAMVVVIKGAIIIVGPVITDEIRPAIATVTSIPISIVTVTLMALNLSRRGARFYNNSTNRFLFLKEGAGASLASFTVRVGPQSFYEVDFPAYTGIITGIWNMAGAGACLATELT